MAWAVWKSEEEKSSCKSVVVHHNISLCLLSKSTSPWTTWIIIHYITTWIIAFFQNVLAQYSFPSISSLCITFSNMGQQCAKYGRLQASWDRGVWLLDFNTLNCIFAQIYVFESLYFWWWRYYDDEINKDIQTINSIYFPHNVHWFDLLARCLRMTKLLLQN